MLVRDVMNKNVITVKPDLSVREAVKLMTRYHIGSLVVMENERIVGILTEGDILRKVVIEERDLDETKVKEIMSENVITVEPDKRIEDAVELMTQHKIKKLPVVEDDKLIGIITTSDIIVVEPKLIEAVASLISLKIPGYRGG